MRNSRKLFVTATTGHVFDVGPGLLPVLRICTVHTFPAALIRQHDLTPIIAMHYAVLATPSGKTTRKEPTLISSVSSWVKRGIRHLSAERARSSNSASGR